MPRTAVAQGSRVDAILTGVLAAAALVALALPPDRREPVAAAVRRSVGVPLLMLQERAERTRAAFLAHDSTSRVIDSLGLETADVRALRAENDHLRGLLGLSARLRWGFIASEAGFVPAQALGDLPAGPASMVTLNVGSRSGVVRYAPVIAPAGLVGRVSSADPNTSLVELYSHESFRVSAMTADQRVVGIVSPYRGGELDDEYLLEMSGVQFRDTLRAGTVIYTSGLGGTVPAFIPVGTVVRELDSGELWVRTYLLQPVVRPGDIRSVVVLLPDRAAAGVEGIWVTRPDSVLQAVVAAGDSLQRARAAADSVARVAAIRQAVLDSLRSLGVELTPGDSAAAVEAGAPPVARPGGAPARRPAAPLPAAPPPAAPSVTPAPIVPSPARPPVPPDSARPATRPDTVPPPDTLPPGSAAAPR